MVILILLQFTGMLDSVAKFMSFLTIGGVTALAILLQYYRKRTAAESVAVNVEVIETFTFILHVFCTVFRVDYCSVVNGTLM